MKKFLWYVLITLAVVGSIYTIFTGKLSLFIELFKSKNDSFEYTNSFKINELQLEKSDFYYNLLTDNQKKIYSSIISGVSELKKSIIVTKYDINTIEEASLDTKEALNALLSDHPEIFFLNSEYTVSIMNSIFGHFLDIELDYIVKNKDELNNMLSNLNVEINKIVSEVSNLDEYDKVLYVHDFLAKNIKYYYNEENTIPNEYHTAYNALIRKEAVCDGITKACQLILGKIGVENYLITGYINTTPHAWNFVNLNGNWLHIDVTSDKYIKDVDDNTLEPVHTYFCVNTEFIKNTHSIDKLEKLPSSVSNEYTYYNKKNCYIASNQNFESRVNDIVKLQKDRKIVEFATDFEVNVPERLLRQLYNINFNNLKSNGSSVTMNYYNEQNVYIVQKK